MVSGIIGTYLVTRGLLTQEQLRDVMYEQKKTRAKLGLIAVAQGMLTSGQADRINRAQAKYDKRFGDLALEMGMLTKEQIESLLSMQGDPYLSFAQTMEDMGLLNIAQLEQCLLDFQAEAGFSDDDLDAIKRDDVDAILALYLPKEAEHFAELCGVCLRTMIRFVDTDVYPLQGTVASEVAIDHAAVQQAEGDMLINFGLSGTNGALLPLARTFGKEEFASVDGDALDAVAEFVNCVTGLYASGISKRGIELELLPPAFSAGLGGAQADQMLVLPLSVGGRQINLMASKNTKINLQFK